MLRAIQRCQEGGEGKGEEGLAPPKNPRAMDYVLEKQAIHGNLPITDGGLTLRPWTRLDLDVIAGWPGYPFPYESFDYQLREKTSAERDRHFRERQDNPDRITLILDKGEQRAVGYLALVEINWARGTVGNMAVRVSPGFCDRGLGARLLGTATKLCLSNGFASLRLDVAASNHRAVRCYEKAGYRITGEFWREDDKLKEYDLKRSEFDFLRPHVRFEGKAPELRFYWMEIRREKDWVGPEKIGVLAGRGKTMKQRQAPVKARSTREAKKEANEILSLFFQL